MRRKAVDTGIARRNHVTMDFEDASPRARPSDLLVQLASEDLDRLSVHELDERVERLTCEIERTRARRDKAINQKASADALFRK